MQSNKKKNEKEFIDNSYKLANSGYSFLLPALALGISQSNLSNIKDLENDLLEDFLNGFYVKTLTNSCIKEYDDPNEEKSFKFIKALLMKLNEKEKNNDE